MTVYQEFPQNLVKCRSPTFSWQVDNVILYTPDLYMFLIFSSLACLLNLFIITLNIKYPQIRKRPGDLFCGLAVAELTLSLHWLISSLYQYFTDNQNVKSSDVFCQINSYFSITAGIFEFFYNISIYTYIVCAIKNLKILKIAEGWYLHAAVVIVSFLITFFVKIFGYSGKTMFGTCSIKSENQFPLKGIGLLLVYIFISLSTLMYLNYKLSNIKKYQKLQKFYQFYMYSCIATWSCLVCSQIMMFLNCRYFQKPSLNFFVTLGNACKIITTLYLPIVRITDPNIRPVFRAIFKISKNSIKQKDKQELPQNSVNNSQTTINDISMNSSIARNINSHLLKNQNQLVNKNSNSLSEENNNQQKGIEMVNINKEQKRDSSMIQQFQGQSLALSLVLPQNLAESINLEDFQIDHAVYEQDKSKYLFANFNEPSQSYPYQNKYFSPN
ncbi:transmembrane protein, putative (macronuclear) [Tetrahymena thermophila SB210]|uniref:Transmembrane protein, putative n=1 Tax=Tetrahymena thermophila (strain SB210) TaxID=312017 RepID=Q24CG2_TETTS|nr:transmembrane protein, putative [Tetrahymena thermophila SB210]EAS05498.2 transmembrane protein, putative [Tetrahymena thermophila SB210]|eukprot:XP_001025743.2 transmembrane protein, putative [Tetrahymena thermophila SB210]